MVVKINGESLTEEKSEIIKFMSGKCVFVTGATGFLGKVLIEQLLHNCKVDHIYILIRPKKGKSSNSRLNELLDSQMFTNLTGDWRSKIKPVEGEMGIPFLGISETMKEELFNSVEIVFHCAATVRFDESLRRALLINVQGTFDVISLCKKMTKLKSAVHVSTAFAHCARRSIDEQFYTPGLNYKKALTLLKDHDENSLNSLESTLLNGWPNTYTFTKAIAEEIVRIEGKNLPIAVFRPAIVTNTYSWCTVPGFIDNAFGPVGCVVGIGFGVLKSICLPKKIPAHIVPADFCINNMLASAWTVGTKKFEEMPIYNLSIHKDNSMSFATMLNSGINHGHKVPSIRCMWYNTVLITENQRVDFIARFFLHMIPALLGDMLLKLVGKKTILLTLCLKVHNLLDKVSYFAVADWNFNCDNTINLYASLNEVDKKIFYFDMKVIEWQPYLATMIDGIRLFIFKENLSNLEAAQKRYFKLKILHYTVVYGFYALVVYFLYSRIQHYCFPIMQSDFKPINII